MLCQVWGIPGAWEYDEYDDTMTFAVQIDSDLSGVATCFGWTPCETDGTVDCSHKTASAMIADARQYIEDECLETVVDDPGFFD